MLCNLLSSLSPVFQHCKLRQRGHNFVLMERTSYSGDGNFMQKCTVLGVLLDDNCSFSVTRPLSLSAAFCRLFIKQISYCIILQYLLYRMLHVLSLEKQACGWAAQQNSLHSAKYLDFIENKEFVMSQRVCWNLVL